MSPLPKSVFNDESAREYNRSRLMAEVGQALWELMQHSEVKRSELAERLEISKAAVTKMLAGERNFTLKTLADVFLALGRAPHVVLGTDPAEYRAVVDEGTPACTPREIVPVQFNAHREVPTYSFPRPNPRRSDQPYDELQGAAA
jgi:plasmid maintenance system antidote protein VapI